MGRSSGTVDASVPGSVHAPDLEACRPMRADAQRNRAALITSARAVFTERGSAASLEEIARRAGVGVGTLYRHFPTRPDLVQAVYVEEVEALCRSAEDEVDGSSWDALVRWFHRFVDYVATKHALLEELMATIGQDAPVFLTCHDAIFAAGSPLLERAKKDGLVRAEVDFIDVIRMVGAITMIRNARPEDVRRVLAMALDGLRYQGSGTAG